MTNDNIHYTIYDRPLKWTILLLIPRWVLPNYVTVVRFLMTPFVLIMLWRDQWVASLILFAIAASTDMIDGALARTRKQITEWGTVADPIADKLLIGSVVVVFVARAINLSFALAILVLELMIILGAWYRHRRTGKLVSANEFGKIKMLLQCLGVGVLIFAKVIGVQLVVPFAVATFGLAMVFAIASLLTYGL